MCICVSVSVSVECVDHLINWVQISRSTKLICDLQFACGPWWARWHVRPAVHQSISPSLCPSVRPSVCRCVSLANSFHWVIHLHFVAVRVEMRCGMCSSHSRSRLGFYFQFVRFDVPEMFQMLFEKKKKDITKYNKKPTKNLPTIRSVAKRKKEYTKE